VRCDTCERGARLGSELVCFCLDWWEDKRRGKIGQESGNKAAGRFTVKDLKNGEDMSNKR